MDNFTFSTIFPLPLYTMLLCGPNDYWRLLFWTTLFWGGGGEGDFSWEMGIGGQNFNNWFQRMVKFYAFLKRSTEFISIIVGCQLWNPLQLNNSIFLCWISMKFCLVVVPHKINLNFYFWHDWLKDDVTNFELLRLDANY